MKMLKREITKYYKWGSPDVTLNNMATKVNGFASGMNGSRYLTCQKVFDISKANSWEIQAKIKTTSDITTQYGIVNSGRSASAGGSCGAGLRVYQGKIELDVALTANISQRVLIGYACSKNTEYLVKGEFTGSAYNLWVNGTLVATKATTSKGLYNATYNNQLGIGATPIDLTQSHIIIDGETIWSGEYDTYVGAWVDEGVMSGFTTSSYGIIPNYCKTKNGTYVFKFKTGSDITATQSIVHGENFMAIEIGSGKLTTYNWGTKTTITPMSVTANTTYWVKVIINGTSVQLLTSTNGTDYTSRSTYTDTGINATSTSYQFRLGLASFEASRPFKGTIYLDECYVEHYNSKFWTGLKKVESTYSDYKFMEHQPVYYACKTGNKYYAWENKLWHTN